MTWHAFHQRGETLRTVVTTADDRRDGRLPMDVPGVAENFTDELDLLSALMLKWHARLSGRIEHTLMSQPMDLEAAVAAAWRDTAEELPGVRMILDRAADHPAGAEMRAAIARAQEREWIRLAAAAGLANDESRAAALAGRRLEQRARSEMARSAETEAGLGGGPSEDERLVAAGPCRSSLVERIRAALVA